MEPLFGWIALSMGLLCSMASISVICFMFLSVTEELLMQEDEKEESAGNSKALTFTIGSIMPSLFLVTIVFVAVFFSKTFTILFGLSILGVLILASLLALLTVYRCRLFAAVAQLPAVLSLVFLLATSFIGTEIGLFEASPSYKQLAVAPMPQEAVWFYATVTCLSAFAYAVSQFCCKEQSKQGNDSDLRSLSRRRKCRMKLRDGDDDKDVELLSKRFPHSSSNMAVYAQNSGSSEASTSEESTDDHEDLEKGNGENGRGYARRIDDYEGRNRARYPTESESEFYQSADDSLEYEAAQFDRVRMVSPVIESPPPISPISSRSSMLSPETLSPPVDRRDGRRSSTPSRRPAHHHASYSRSTPTRSLMMVPDTRSPRLVRIGSRRSMVESPSIPDQQSYSSATPRTGNARQGGRRSMAESPLTIPDLQQNHTTSTPRTGNIWRGSRRSPTSTPDKQSHVSHSSSTPRAGAVQKKLAKGVVPSLMSPCELQVVLVQSDNEDDREYRNQRPLDSTPQIEATLSALSGLSDSVFEGIEPTMNSSLDMHDTRDHRHRRNAKSARGTSRF